MSFSKKLTSVILAVCMVVSVLSVAIVPAAAETEYETYAQETVQGSNILHCFNWSYNNIKAKLPEIARAGYTAVQTSPVQSPKDYKSSWTDTPNQWWKMYQPLGFSISNNSWLGTKDELTSLCTEAEKYNIKVVVDIVANHLANNGTDGGTYSYINSGVESDLKNANYYHTNNIRVNDDNRHNITQYHLGMPDLNTGNTYVQQRALGLLEECIDCGVDGFRFDAAKHIELPDDPSNCKSDFWKNVLGSASNYAEEKGKEAPFYYGEILGSPGPNTDISKYTKYMAVTDNETGDLALDKAYWSAASELANSDYAKGASADKSVLWAESHDTYMGESGSAWKKNTKDVTSEVINRAWAIVGARAESTALFFARPNATMGAASTDNNWKSTEVSEVNKFKNHFEGTNEYLASSGSAAYIERGTKGVVISKLDGGGSVNLTAHQMASGTYTDQVTGNPFTVSNGKISGTVGSSGVAVVYDPEDVTYNTISQSPLYLKPHSTWDGGSYTMYFYNSHNTDVAWVSMAPTENNDGYYTAAVPSGKWTNVIFCRMKSSSGSNIWENVEYQTVDLYPDDGKNCFTVTEKPEGQHYKGAWSVYGQQETTEPTQPTSSGTESDTCTVYAVDNANWNSKMNVHYWGDGETSWPGTEMAQYSGNKVFKFDVPKNVSGIIFNVENGSKQTVNIESGITDGAVFVISTEKSGNNYKVSLAPTYYLVGSMSNWSNNDDYAFSITNADAGKYEYKLSGVQLNANTEIKVHDNAGNNGNWYPDGSNNNYTVSADGVYDVYFRPNADGGTGWHNGYFKLEKVCTVTWKNYDGTVLKTEKVSAGTVPSYSGTIPTKDPTEQYTYTFSGWKKPNDETVYTDNFPEVSGDVTYTAQFAEALKTYTVIWKNYDGEVLETDTDVAYGSKPSYDGDTPQRESEGYTTYAFSGWAPQITDETTITEDTTYIARFSTNTQTYTITWKDGDGNVLKTESCIEGITPHYMGETPTKTATAQYTYSFNNTWDPPLVAADSDTIYTAQFDSTVNKYTVDFKNYDGTVLQTSQVDYGTTPAYTGTTPAKPDDLQNTYIFNGWSPEVVTVTEEATYTAQFTSADVPKYEVSVNNAIGWDDVYVYYWKGDLNNNWPGTKLSGDADNFTFNASIPHNVEGIIFNNGKSGDELQQTGNITANIADGTRWAVSNYNDTVKVNVVPTYYLVGSMTNWTTTGAPSFTAIKNEDGLEEYKLSNVSLNAGDELKVIDSKNHWYPNGSDNNYIVPANCTYDFYFRPNGDGNSNWHEKYIYAAIKHDWDMDDNAVDWTWTPSSGDDPGINSITAKMTAHCKNCDATEEVRGVVEAIGYDVPGCTEAGTRHYIATAEFNGKTFSSTHDYTIPSSYGSHDLSHHSATTPTASANGTTEYWKCDRCGKYFSDANAQTEITEKQTLVPYFTYTKDGNDVLVSGYYGADTDIVIPDTVPDYYPDETLRGEAITKIPRGPFTDNTRITSVTMGDYITEIGWQAFMNCFAIKEVHIGSGIQLIASGSFFTGNSLESFYCTKVDNTSVYNTLFTYNTFNSDECITFYGPHTGKFYEEAHMDFINYRGVSNFKYIGTDAHTDTVTFNWDGYTCTEATAGCSKCDYIETISGVTVSSVVTTEPTYEADGVRTYTASVTYNSTEYTDTKTEVIPYEDIITNLVGHSISLDGSIGINFYMELSDDVIDNKGTAYMHFTIPKNGEPGTKNVYVKDAETRTVGDKTYYLFTCDVAAKEIESNITAQLFNGDQKSRIYTYSVKQYADYLIAHQDESATFKKAVPLVEAMLTYGENARYYFDKTDEKPDDLDVNIPESTGTFYDLPAGVAFGGATLSLKSETTLSLYFNSVTEPNLTCTDQGMTCETDNTGTNEYVIRIRGIAAYDLDKQFTVKVNGQDAVTYSPLTYCYKAQQTSSNTKLVNTVKALYNYWLAAQAYFGKTENGGGN